MRGYWFFVAFGVTYKFRKEQQADWAAEQCFLLSGYRPEISYGRFPQG